MEKLPRIFSSATFNSETVSDFGRRFESASLPRHDISIPFKFGELLWWPLYLCKHLRTVLMGALLRHVQIAQSPMHLVESAAPAGSSRSVALFNELSEQKLINNFNYCLQQH